MVSESIERLLDAPFEGRVVSQVDDPNSKYTDFDGNPTILYPWSEEGLRHAVKLREAMGEKGFVRSGLSSSGDGSRSAEGCLVIDLSHFCDVEVMEAAPSAEPSVVITVGAAAKNSQLLNELVLANAFLPIGDNPVKSVVSSLLSDQPGYFDRSMGRLRDYVDELHVITPQGDLAQISSGTTDFNSILEGTFGGVIKTILFSAVPASAEAVHVIRASFVYSHEDFNIALSLLHHEDISETMDVSVHAYHGAYGLGIISVTVAGRPEDDDQINAVVDRLMALYVQNRGEDWTETMVHRIEARSPAEITALILEGGMSGNPYVDRNLACTHYNRVVSLDNFDSFRASLITDLENLLGGEETDAIPDVFGSVRLSLINAGNLVVNADVFLPKVQTEVETAFATLVSQRLGTPIQSRPHIAALQRYRGQEVPELDLSRLRRVVLERDNRQIPDFGGEIYAPRDKNYDAKRTQYASSSYPDKQGMHGSMYPYLVAYPRNNCKEDIAAAIAFAKSNDKKVVARSGGHQYSGLSSGGEDTILLSMDLYNDLEVYEDGGKKYARVGVGNLLTDIAAEFKNKRVTIPHGECPRVGIGGHVQTGGFGHIIRSYGLRIDYVDEFKIILCDGTEKVVERPTDRDEESLYWAVLGGGPGSFGILTEITFECIQDEDHSNSWGSARAFRYGKKLFTGAMEEIKRWTEQISQTDFSSELPPDVDMCVTVINIKNLPFNQALFLLEMVNGDKNNGNGDSNNKYLEDARDRILDDKEWSAFWIPCWGYRGKNRHLSFMSDAKVRRKGTTDDGREFPEPYKKRLNCTKQPLSDEFVNAFVDLIDRVVKSGKVQLVFQMFLGGGAYASPEPNPPLNSICHRDVTLGIVFDCFYKKNGEKDAEDFQKEMKELLKEFSGEQEIRMLWGSFGDTKISDDKVRKYYYDDETWSSLQKVKKKVDSEDMFHTEFTVQLPV